TGTVEDIGPLREGARREQRIQYPDQLPAMNEAHRRLREARVRDQVVATDGAAEGHPVSVRVQHDQMEPTDVHRPVEVEERMWRGAPAARGVAVAGRDRRLQVAREHPHAALEEGHADLLPDPAALP